MKRYLASTILLLFTGVFAGNVLAGPQHWGFGFGYLVLLEQGDSGNNVLSVYEPPLRVKDCPWLLRWRDSSGQYDDVVRNGITVGDFWPKPIGKEYLVAMTGNTGKGLTGRAFDPPEVFSTRPWKVLGEFVLPLPGLSKAEKLVAVASGSPLGGGSDSLLILTQEGDGERAYALCAYAPPKTPDAKDWRLVFSSMIDPEMIDGKEILGMACSDFGGYGEEQVGLLSDSEIIYVKPFIGEASMTQSIIFAGRDKLSAGPGKAGFFAADDFLKDGLAYIALGSDDGTVRFRTGPKPKELFKTIWVRENETFAGAKLDGQKVGEGADVMTGRLDNPAGKAIAAAGGRLFGYILMGCDERKEKIWMPWKFHGYDDVEISFANRTPVYRLGVPKKWQDGNWPWEPDDHYGWPFQRTKKSRTRST